MGKLFRFAIVSACVLAAVSCTLYDASTSDVKRYALVYGMTNYVVYDSSTDYNDPNLTYPSADAKSMAELLAGWGYTVKSRWVDAGSNVYVDGTAVGTLSDASAQAPSEDVLKSDMQAIGSQMDSNDLFYFYFSGHGTYDDSGSEYFIPYGGIVGEKISSGVYAGLNYYYANADTCVSDTELGNYLTTYIPTSKRVVTLDTCYSGGFIGDTLEVDIVADDTNTSSKKTSYSVSASTIASAIANYAGYTSYSSDGISPGKALVVSACGAGEYSTETDGYGHGVMTYFLLNTLSKADLNGDGSVTVLEWYSLAKAGVDEDWNSLSWVKYYGYCMEPRVSGGPVDYVLF